MTDEEPNIVMSHLCCTETREGMSVEIMIYKGEKDDVWILEVVDEEGASTIWDEPFKTDQAAYEEVMRTIDEEGISTFLHPPATQLH